MLPFRLSDLPWWEWLLSAVALAIVAGVTYLITIAEEVEDKGGAKPLVLALLFGAIFFASLVASFLCAIIGIISYVKGDWYS